MLIFPAKVSKRRDGLFRVALLRALDALKPPNADQKAGVDIARGAIQTPARQIAENSGADGAVIVGKSLDRADYGWGYDARAAVHCDLVKKAIIDPAKVLRSGLEDAASVAGLLITTEAMIAVLLKKDGAERPPTLEIGIGDYRVSVGEVSRRPCCGRRLVLGICLASAWHLPRSPGPLGARGLARFLIAR